MEFYSLALFFHIVGALGFFIALGLELFNLQQLQRLRTVEQLSAWFGATRAWRGLGGLSMLVILVAGTYMTIVAWGGADWVEVAFTAMIVQGIVAAALTMPRMRAIQKAMSSEHGTLSPTLDSLLRHPMLWVSMSVRMGIGLGIIYLMTVKPALVGSLAVMAVSVVVGLAVAIALLGARRNQTVAA